MTSRAGGNTPLLSTSWSNLSERCYFETSLQFESGLWRSMSDRPEIYLGSLDTQLIKLSQRYRLSTRQNIMVTVPLGRFNRLDRSGVETILMGVGDLSLSYQFSLIESGIDLPSSTFTLSLALGLIAPTGRYSPDETLSDSEIIPQAGGVINRNTFNAQTSLGADVWSSSLGLYGRWSVLPQLIITQAVGFSSPLHKTRDLIRWGSDFSARLGLTWWLWSRGAIELGGSWSRHLSDQIYAPESSQGSLFVGGRQQINAELSTSMMIYRRVRCRLGGMLTPWAEVKSPQLVQSSQVRVGCHFSWGASLSRSEG